MSAVVALVGKPNVGKSTLFNRFLGERKAIESPIAGTTRDRLYAQVKMGSRSVVLIDTGGLELDEKDDLEENVQKQSGLAIAGADLILFLVDATEELTSEDYHALDLIRRSKKPILLVVNKADNERLKDEALRFYELGIEHLFSVSALHGEGVSELESEMLKQIELLDLQEEAILDGLEGVKIAFVGRPNVGKSTMINALLGKERVVVSEQAGTTRDASYIPFEYDEQKFVLVDTAGLRKRGRIEKGLEKYSSLRSFQALGEADIAVLMIDFEEGLCSQDMHISEFALQEAKGLILVVNKIDTVPQEVRDDLENRFISVMKRRMAYVPWAPVVFTSAQKRSHIFAILDLAKQIAVERQKTIPQDDLNVWLEMTLAKHPPSRFRGKRQLSIHHVRQVSTAPPRFIFECSHPKLMHFSYARYLENELRAQFGFQGTAVQFSFKGMRRKTRDTV